MKNNMRSIHCPKEKTWIAYSQGLLSESRRLGLEEHLLTCDSCLAIYLDILAKDTDQSSVSQLSRDFTDHVLAEISAVSRIPVKKEKEFLASKMGILISYCAAASIALFFWGGGYFDGLSANLSKGVQYLDKIEISEKVPEPEKGLIQAGWTHKVYEEKRTSFIQNLISDKE